MITATAALVGACAGCIGGVIGGLVVVAFTKRHVQSDEITSLQRRQIRDRVHHNMRARRGES